MNQPMSSGFTGMVVEEVHHVEAGRRLVEAIAVAAGVEAERPVEEVQVEERDPEADAREGADQPGNAPTEPEQRKCADAGDAGARLELLELPSALDADQHSRGQTGADRERFANPVRRAERHASADDRP